MSQNIPGYDAWKLSGPPEHDLIEEERFKVVDGYDNEIVVGSRVVGDPKLPPGKVTLIGDPDGDYDDSIGRYRELTPTITVQWANLAHGVFSTWNDTPINEPTTYRCDDLEVVAANYPEGGVDAVR